MERRRSGVWALAVVGCLALLGASCAKQVGDIDRTQPNRVSKADLEGVWYMMETVTDLPATTGATFIGETGKTEKIVWQIEEEMLMAYRAYPRLPGSDNVDGGVDTSAPDYRESPVAIYPILGHFDIQRGYSSETGEQTNVIEENSSDRPWYERDFIRVDWSRNLITNFEFIADWLLTPIQATYQIDAERGEARSIYFERDAGDKLAYFDVPRRLLVEPDFEACIYAMWYAWGTDDCTAAEVELVTAFSRTEKRRDYEPLHYSDQDMTRFGYFRSERVVFDQQRGPLESTRQKLANRHNIWKQTYEKNPDGSLATDDDGQLIAIPMSQREVRTVPYYMSTTFPDDPLIEEASQETMRQWNEIGRESAALAKGIAVADLKEDVFVLCHNPVAEADHEACGARGFSPRPGDLRFSTLHWVETEQIEGPLGYGPSSADPETGEVISGRAYVYGSGLNTYANYAVDVIRFMNGDLDGDDLKNAEHVRELVRQRADREVGLGRISPRLKDVPLKSERVRPIEKTARRAQHRQHLKGFDRAAVEERLERARDAGLNAGGAADEQRRAVAAHLRTSPEELTAEQRARYDRASLLNPTHLKDMHRRHLRAIARSVDFADMIDPYIQGTASKYAGRTDYEQIWRELRAATYLATALHEVGHTVGLRHNFQGSYDSMNYFDRYWELRPENMRAPTSAYDLFEQSQLTQAQHDGQMRELQYSSIMDYGLTFNSDIQGLGKYDRAALVYAYSAGTINEGSARRFAPGFVEVFKKNLGDLGEAGDILTARDENGFSFDDATTPIVPYLERWHYTTVMRAFPSVEDALDRDWMRIDDFREAREVGGDEQAVRVPYLFCSDEWTGALLSCQVFDAGADPFEMTKAITDRYRTHYYFDNFKRDRLGWDPINALFGYFYYTFLPLSDYFQNWYLAPEGADEVMDNYWWLSINAGFNLLIEAIATPPYGTFCTTSTGTLLNLSDDSGLVGPGQTSEYYLQTYCDPEQPFFEVPQGDGRRTFSAYDVDSGYYFGDQPLEAGHYWATLAAFWAMVDPEAFVLGTDADVGTFSISYYDFFRDEIHQVVNAVMTENFTGFSPVLEITGETAEGKRIGRLHHQVLNPIFDGDNGLLIHPETGEDLSTSLGPDRRTLAICEPCEANSDCHGATGALGGTFCQPIDDSGELFCLQDCFEDETLCSDDETCDDNGNCVPESGSCDEVPECDRFHPHGACPQGESCNGSQCEAIWPVVETDSTFGLVDDMLFYGMLYTTFSFSTRYNDQINVFKLGGEEEIVPGEGFELLSFTDPISGDSYGAVREACEGGDESATGGPTGLCEPCEDHSECAGFTGDNGGAFCQPVTDPDDEVWFCLIDCTDGPESCPEGTRCNPEGNCVPRDGVCDTEAGQCSEDFPLGSCEGEETCVEGECVGESQSAQCRFGLDKNPGSAQMVERGQILAERYNDTLAAYYADDGSDAERELTLFRIHSRAQYELESHIERINNIRAIFAIFGKVY